MNDLHLWFFVYYFNGVSCTIHKISLMFLTIPLNVCYTYACHKLGFG